MRVFHLETDRRPVEFDSYFIRAFYLSERCSVCSLASCLLAVTPYGTHTNTHTHTMAESSVTPSEKELEAMQQKLANRMMKSGEWQR